MRAYDSNVIVTILSGLRYLTRNDARSYDMSVRG
jgi:hypothetical protein